MTLGERISTLRQAKNLTQKELAQRLNVSTGTVATWESNEELPTITEIADLSKSLNVTTDFLICGVSMSKPESITQNNQPHSKRNKTVILLTIILFLVLSVGVFSFIYLYNTVKSVVAEQNTSNDIPPETQISLSPSEIFDIISPSTVEISGDAFYFTSTGTGFFIDDQGTVITNFHVIEDCFEAQIILYDGTEYPVLSVLGHNKDLDIAILSTSCANSIPLDFREEAVITGEKAYTLGSSLGLTGTFAEGIISSASRKIGGANFIQTTAPISNGNSGGPLVDENGKVIGITTAAFEEGQNLNLAVPIILALNIDRDDDYSMHQSFLDKYDLGYWERRLCELYLYDMDEDTREELKDILDNAPLK